MPMPVSYTHLDVYKRQRFRLVIQPSQFHALIEGEVGGGKKRLDKVGAFGQKPLGDVDVHLAVSYTHLHAVPTPSIHFQRV